MGNSTLGIREQLLLYLILLQSTKFQTFASMTDAARWKATVYVGGLAPEVNLAAVEAAFLPFGEIADVSVP